MSPPPPRTDALSLEDRQAIVDATIRYCWAIDTRTYDDLDDVFVPDVRIDYRTTGAPFEGLEPLKKLVAGVLDPLDCSQHMVSNHEIVVEDGEPRSRCYFHAQHVRAQADGGSNYVVAGIYTDRWRETPDGWRSVERGLEVLWTEGNPRVVAP